MRVVLDRLTAAFDEAADQGTAREVWWRDDDAVRLGPKLAALAATAARHGAPLALAAIPRGAEPELLAAAEREGWTVLQHGVAHTNHQASGKPAELGDARPVHSIIAACLTARDRLASPAFLPVMVPPWNRMRCDLKEPLAAAGYVGLSLFGAAPSGSQNPHGLRRVDTHIDPIDWRDTRDLLPASRLDAMLVAALATGGPLGLLTHHAVHTPAVDDFVMAFVKIVSGHPGARWVAARDVFTP